MVRPAGCGVDEAAGNTSNEELVGNHKLDGGVDLLLAAVQHLVELLGLDDRARETVEDETARNHVNKLKYTMQMQ